jgi:hypothetical protein
MIKKFIFGLLCCCTLSLSAHDFTETVDGTPLFFNVRNKSAKTVVLTYEGSIAEAKSYNVAGQLRIPATIQHENTMYVVEAIGPKAFAGAKNLKGVVIPSTVNFIGDFAFEGCDSLSDVVFPGGLVKFGQGVFFRCTALKNITPGSDWKTLDLTMFRWSEALETLRIPAKVTNIQGLKKLKTLRTVEVDVNNPYFKSVDGALYNKSGETLYGVPRAYEGKLKVAEGTKKVLDGALIDCEAITQLVLPSTVEYFSFRETSRMKHLQSVVAPWEKPLSNAFGEAGGKFLLQVVAPNVKLIVPAASKKAYLEALATTAGDYAAAEDATVRYAVHKDELLTVKNIQAVKDLKKYE